MQNVFQEKEEKQIKNVLKITNHLERQSTYLTDSHTRYLLIVCYLY